MVAVNSAGDFVLFFSKAIVVSASVGVGYALMEVSLFLCFFILAITIYLCVLQDKQGFDNKAVPLMIVGFVAFFVAHCFVTVYEVLSCHCF